MVSTVIGIVVTVVGLSLLFGPLGWIKDFLVILRGSIPVVLIIGGISIVAAGLSNIKEQAKIIRQDKERPPKKKRKNLLRRKKKS